MDDKAVPQATRKAKDGTPIFEQQGDDDVPAVVKAAQLADCDSIDKQRQYDW